jgi:two-component system, NtrC family, response regulator AtoC
MLALAVLGRNAVFSAPLTRDRTFLVGRGPGCDVRLEDGGVSRVHLRVTATADHVEVVDVGSANGTFLGTSRLVAGEAVSLPLGASITLGATMLVVEEAAPPLRAIWGEDELAKQFEQLRLRAVEAGGSFALVYLTVDAPEGWEEQTTERAPTELAKARRLHAVLSRALRPADLLAGRARGRYVLLLADTASTLADERAADLAAELVAHGFTATVTAASYPRDGATCEELERHARARAAGPLRTPTPPRAPEGALARLAPIVTKVARGDVSVLVFGETGVGKEVLARTIHESSPRAAAPLLTLNCGALSETLLEAELFGYERGAFTGATRAKPGLLESADGGTIFLDELGEMPPALQVKLLRVLEQREITRVGGLTPRKIDVRFIAATHRDLEAEVVQGTFRRDLYYRLNGVILHVPPLRERIDEIEPLAVEFARKAMPEGRRPPELSPEVLVRLRAHLWPGNIRELRNVIERAVLLCTGDVITLEHVPSELMTNLPPQETRAPKGAKPTTLPPPAPTSYIAGVDSGPRERIAEALRQCAGNQTQAARLLGVSRRTLVSLLGRYDLPRPRKQVS